MVTTMNLTGQTLQIHHLKFFVTKLLPNSLDHFFFMARIFNIVRISVLKISLFFLLDYNKKTGALCSTNAVQGLGNYPPQKNRTF